MAAFGRYILPGLNKDAAAAKGASGENLQVNKINFTQNPLVFDLDAGNLRLKRGGGDFLILNSGNITITDLLFQHLAPVGGRPAAVKASFKINGQLFETTKYLRQ